MSINDRVEKLNVWRRGSERAPHKPLLLLLALGRWSRHASTTVSYEEIAPELEALLKEFGPSRKSYHPEYPFWRLQNDRLWLVRSDEPLRSRQSNTDPPKSELISKRATGELHGDVLDALGNDPTLLQRITEQILESHFPQTLHEDILDAVGIEIEPRGSMRRKRDPKFRERVLLAYEYRCSVCNLDLRLGSVTIGLEAAHIKWRQAGGPDTEENGLALCSTHHKTFDLGAFTIVPEGKLLVSERVTGSSEFEYTLLRHHGRPIRSAQRPDHCPAPAFLAWHRRQVFKEAPRHVAS